MDMKRRNPMSYRINEGHLNVQVLHDRSTNVLTLAAWDGGTPLNLTISRGAKEPQESLKDCVVRQVQDMAGQLEGFQWQDTGRHAGKVVYETGRSSYRLGPVQVHQCVAVAQLNDVYLLMLFLSSAQPLSAEGLRQWEAILASFEPDHGELPMPLVAEDDEEDEEGDE
jgi:hypothetical protein